MSHFFTFHKKIMLILLSKELLAFQMLWKACPKHKKANKFVILSLRMSFLFYYCSEKQREFILSIALFGIKEGKHRQYDERAMSQLCLWSKCLSVGIRSASVVLLVGSTQLILHLYIHCGCSTENWLSFNLITLCPNSLGDCSQEDSVLSTLICINPFN